jgi:HAD superfamily hydrolase (TIGR01509 family)
VRRGSAVFLDLDGTLVDTAYLHTYAWWRALDDAGERVPMAAVHPLIGMGSSELLSSLLGRDDHSISESHGRYFARLHALVRPLPGADDLICRLHASKVEVVVVTSAKERDLEPLLGALTARPQISVVVHGEEADRAKPAPDLYEIALDRVGRDRQACVALGDAVWDIEAAAKARISCVGLLTGGVDRHVLQQSGAVAVYRTCVELLANWDDSPLAALSSAG